MERDELLFKHQQMLGSLSCLPKKLMSVHTLDNATEFVLHELCNQGCFNLHKAAYFIDNPDFNILKGVAGFSQAEAYTEWDQIWNNPESFTTFMQKSEFNQKTRKFCVASAHRNQQAYGDVMLELAQELGVVEPAFVSWDIKHDNKGLLLYEKQGVDVVPFEEHFLNSLYLLNFCPTY